MKNKTIEILTDDTHVLPVGTKVRRWYKGILQEEFVAEKTIVKTIVHCTYNTVSIVEVDFSEVEHLYPHKGMDVPEEGIEFADGVGNLIDCGEHGFVYETGTNITEYVKYGDSPRLAFKLKRTLPKTITVCADCFKEVCECKREEGWYRVLSMNNKWYLRYYVNGAIYTHKEGRSVGAYKEIDWNNPINPIPEVER